MRMQDGADLLEQSGLVTDALRTLASRHRRTRAQLAVLAHSMGGVAALHPRRNVGLRARERFALRVAVGQLEEGVQDVEAVAVDHRRAQADARPF